MKKHGMIFFDSKLILELLDLSQDIENFIDVGSGYGTFLIPASKIITGIAIGVEVDQDYLDICQKRIEKSSATKFI